MDNAHLVIEKLLPKLSTKAAPELLQIHIDNMSIFSGQTAVFAGHNGSGKTTILEAVFGLRLEYAVEARLFGKSLSEANASKRNKLGVCFQRQTFNDVVKVSDIVSLHRSIFGPSAQINIDFLQMEQLSSKRYGHLSGGEQQRVNLFFALAHDPLVFIADEPEKGLDEATLNALCNLLDDRAAREQTTLIASHSHKLFDIANRFVLLEAGNVVFDGKVDRAIEAYIGPASWEMTIKSNDVGEGIAEVVRSAPHAILRKISDDRVRVYGVNLDVIDELKNADLVSAIDQRLNKPADLVVVTERQRQ